VKDTGAEIKGTVLRIERSSIYDGNGLRTVVFLKGCPLRCKWCSTPEGLAFGVEQIGGETYGREMSVEGVMKEVRKDSCCYFHSGGGMTLSGGEIFSQPEFTRALIRTACTECIDTAIETSFYAPWEAIEPSLPCLNTAYVDIKFFSANKHKEFCGADNGLILENLRRTNNADGPFGLVVRVPVITGINDDEQELSRIGKFCAGLKRLDHVQLLPYHRLGMDTYRKLGMEYGFSDLRAPSAEGMEMSRAIIRRYVGKVL
jgi:pyruvate formate lyase activating enzyme